MAVLETPGGGWARAHRSGRSGHGLCGTGPRFTRPPVRRVVLKARDARLPRSCGRPRVVVPLSWTIGLGVAAFLVVLGLGLLANLSAGAGPVPQRTTVVRVEPGETLTDLARRAVPEGDPTVVAEQIRDLNGLASWVIRPGQPLAVPGSR